MEYQNIRKAKFISRPNRFIAEILIDGEKRLCHVKNTGRCRELLVPGAEIFVQEWDGTGRKTKYDLIAVNKGARLINMDSQAPNKVFGEWVASGGLMPGVTLIRPESVYGSSRLDFYIEAGERRIYAEVKGVTLEENGAALFPDAPTQRGVKHLCELMECVKNGYEACIAFVIQMEEVDSFSPNRRTHEAFADKLREAADSGVKLLALDCSVTESSLTIRSPVKIKL